MITITNKEKILIAQMLKLASDVFVNHICNDLDEELAKDWSKEEHDVFINKYFKLNNEEPSTEIENFLYLGDSILMETLSNMLLEEVEQDNELS